MTARTMLALACGTLTLLAAAPPPSTPPLLVTSRHELVFVDGARRNSASAGPGTSVYRLLGAVADGSVLVSYDDNGAATVESIAPSLDARKVKSLARGAARFVAPSSDGFLVYDGSITLLRRYDADGNLVGKPVAAAGARDALGIGDATIAIGPGRMWAWDRNGRLQHEALIDAGAIVPLPNNRFAVSDTRYNEIRIYTTNFDRVTTIRPDRPIRTMAAGADGSLAVLIGDPSCANSNAEIDVWDDVSFERPRVRIHDNIRSAVALAVDADAIYAVNTACTIPENGTVAVFNRDGTTRDVLTNVGFPTGVYPFPAARHLP